MRLGVIDVGSNTVHLLVVDAYRGAHPLPDYSHKVALRLAEHLTDEGDISDTGAQRLADFVAECVKVAEDRGVTELMGFATSATRDAGNTDAVLDRVAQRSGVRLQVLSGDEEARTTFLAARRWCGWSAGRLLVLDIGGGSLELAAGIDEEPDVAVSLPLGAGRLTQQLVGDPPSAKQIRELRRDVRSQIAEIQRPLQKVGEPDRVVATSKTFRSLGRLCGAAPSGAGPYLPRTLKRQDLSELVPRLAGMKAARRAELQGVSEARSRQVLAGAIVAEAAMELSKIDELEICPWALREGLILRRLDRLEV